MQAITIHSDKDQYIINIDKKRFDQDTLLKMMEWLRLEELAMKMNTNESILDISEEIKSDWWERNKERFEGTFF
ncbi:hypothetical protein HNQ92_002112 [Rhabdobacter roseus]|uniref:Uncharacterized protein n=1 Tax=Rhabdobacter roseus TaxID=1655419 RepID=A0A840TWE9_9BACT|nr:hypothetical protein [Rhabdobacter roseus]MBB5283969.1 hypothetical protein [Rhabdobacter roseus]